MPILQCKSVSTGYSGTEQLLLSNFDTEFDKGELILLAGRNGCGKSTLLHCLSGLQNPVLGEIVIQNKSLQLLSIAERSQLVSIMFSTPPIMEFVPVREVVLTSVSAHFSPFKSNLEAEEKRVLDLLELCGIAHLSDRFFHTLSDGEKQKTMLARSLAQNTPVILLDEPLAFLDYPSRIQMLELLRRISSTEQKLILVSSHDLDISLPFADGLILLESGGKFKVIRGRENIEKISAKSLFQSNAQSI